MGAYVPFDPYCDVKEGWKMYKDEFGNEFTQCINCETVYLLEGSKSTIPQSCCSVKCEDEYKQFIEDLHFE